MSAISTADPQLQAAVQTSVRALRRIADYSLPPALDRYLRTLGERKEFLNADLMLASLAVIGAIGFAFERLVFGTLERNTVQRWGMVRVAKG